MKTKVFSPNLFDDSEKVCKLLLMVLLATACFVRLFFYFNHKDLWLDELAIALALLNMDFSELLTQPLPYMQSAPLGFMLVSKLLTYFYFDTLTLYIFPMLSSMGLIFLTYRFIREHFDYTYVTVYMLLSVTSVLLVFYSTELKQYMVEALAAFYLVYYFLNNKEAICKGISYKFLLLLCMLSLFSSSIPFIICALACAVLWDLKTVKSIFSYIGRNIFPMALFLAFYISYYFLYLKRTSVAGMQEYWKFSFLPVSSLSDFIYWFKNVFLYVTEYTLYIPFSILGYRMGGVFFVIFFLHGSYLLWKRNKDLFFCTFMPLIVILLVSALRMYPIGTDGVRGARFMLFLYPLLFIPLTVSMVEILQSIFKQQKILHGILALGVVISIASNIFLIIYNPKIQQTEKFIEYIHDNYSNDTALIIFDGAMHAYNYFSHRKILEHTSFKNIDDTIQIVNEKLNHKKHAMILFSHYNEEQVSTIIALLKKLKYNVTRLKDIGAELIIVSR